jgi:acyl carrier protein
MRFIFMAQEQSPQLSADLELEVKTLIVDSLKLEDVDPTEIDSTQPLFGEGLGLDSIDALEIGIAIQKKYAVNFDVQDQNMQQNFSSIRALAAFIAASRP